MGRLPFKLKTTADRRLLCQRFCDVTGYKIPLSYFLSADCYGLRGEGDRGFVAGFVLRRNLSGLDDLRVWQEVPEGREKEESRRLLEGKVVADTTGYFLEDKKRGFIFTLYFALISLFYPAHFFIYSYDRNNLSLARYYGHGRPKKLYTGRPTILEGYTEEQPEVNIEVLTKWGILRIFLMRTKKLIGR